MQVIDLQIFQFFNQIAGNNFINFFVIAIGKYLPYFLVILLAILGFKIQDSKKRAYLFFWAILSIILSRGLITEIIKFLWHRLRPFEALNFNSLFIPDTRWAFPSGHMALMFALVLAAYLVSKKFGNWFLLFSILIGIARIIAGVHWPSDIIGGMAIGLISALFIKTILPKTTFDSEKLQKQ